MKEVSSCQENIDTEAINEKKKMLNRLLNQMGLFAGEKFPVTMKMLTWKQSESI